MFGLNRHQHRRGLVNLKLAGVYSVLKLFTGLATAAFIA
jgi:hypothetical protein